MAEDHARDYAAKAKIDAVRFAIADLVADDDAWSRFGEDSRRSLVGSQNKLTKVSSHIVAVWD